MIPSSKDIMYNPFAAVNPRHLSTAALCWSGNRLAVCNKFTPNDQINSYSSSVFHGQSGPGVTYIAPSATRPPVNTIPAVTAGYQQSSHSPVN